MVYYFIYAKDFSGSTKLNEHYHSNGIKTVEQFTNDVERIKNELIATGEESPQTRTIYLHWGHECLKVNKSTTISSYEARKGGNMYTMPESIVKWIRNNCDLSENSKIKLLYIITDGLIDPTSAHKCADSNWNMYYETVVFHAFNNKLEEIDLSVAASFLKSRCIIYRNHELYDNIDISENFDYDNITVGNFMSERHNLKSYIKLKYIVKRKGDPTALKEIDQLKKLRERLFLELSSPKKSEINLDTKDRSIFLRNFKETYWYRNLNDPDHVVKVEIEQSISTLINYIVSSKKSSSSRFSFDALKFNTKFDKTVAEEPIVDIDVNFAAEQEIEFPDIILDDEKGIPVIILTEFNLLDKIIFHKTNASDAVSLASFRRFKTTIDCPLFLLNDPDISESIGYFYTLNVYKQLLENTKRTEPRTRRPFHGGLVLTDTDEFDKYNDYVISATYFGFKKIRYNTGLFYYLLWKNCENKEWMDRNVVEMFKRYTMRRISETVCKIGLSSLPLDPQENTSLLTALWYCVELSSCIFKHDPINFMYERLRMFYGVAHSMIEILKYFKYDLDLESIEKRIDLIRHVMILKRESVLSQRFYYLLEKIFKKDNGFLVSEIEKPFNLRKLNYLKLHHKEMLPDNIIEEKVNLNEYVHVMNYTSNTGMSKDGEVIFEICEKTFRPFFSIDQSKSFYTDLVKSTKRVVINDDDTDDVKITHETLDSLEFSKTLSLYNLFIHCVNKARKYPTLSEYAEFISNKKSFNGSLVTLFQTNVYKYIEEVYSQYQKIVTKVDVNKFIEVTRKNVKRRERIKNEGVVEFNSDDDINKFITNEELKVNMIKRQ